MSRKLICLLFAVLWLCAAPALAQDVSLGARNFKHLSLAVGNAPPDCRTLVDQGATLSYIHDYLLKAMGPHFNFVNTDNAPVLMTTFDCLRLTDDTDRGGGRTVGFAVNISMRFYRPFHDDLAYIYAATWHKPTLLFIPYRDFNQDYFNELLNESLDEFISLWLAEHAQPLEPGKK
jgi:hypothetical protein